jgi:polyhydroxyalkanoate synthesis regulator protein
LAQLILEQAPSKWAALPAELFHQLIRANDSLLQEFVDKYFHRALMAFEKSQREFEQYMRQALGLNNGLLAMNPATINPVSWGTNWSEMMLGPYMRAFLDKGGEPAAPSEETQKNGADLKTELDALRHEVQELRKELRQQ